MHLLKPPNVLFICLFFTSTFFGFADSEAYQQSPAGCLLSAQQLRTNLGGYCRGPSKSRVIVFVNGIFGDAVDTWSNGQAYWPALLAEDPAFRDADIYVHSFKSPKLANAQEIDELAARMSDFLQVDQVFEKHKEVIFICHSMGGLITRAFLLKRRPPFAAVPMIYFYGTPTAGANIAGIASHLSRNPQLKYMLPMDENGYVGDLQNAWLRTSDDPALNYPAQIASFCAYELKDTWGFRVVTRESATNLCNRETRAVNSDHIDIVKPANVTDDPYVYFKAAYLHTLLSGEPQAAANIIDREMQNHSLVHETSRKEGTRDLAGGLMVYGFRSKDKFAPVQCDEDRTGLASISYSIPKEARIIEAIPTIENQENLYSASVALVNYNRDRALVNYRFHGAQKKAPGICPGVGNANLVINLVVEVH